MRKLLFALSLILLSFVSYSQTSYYSKSNFTGEYVNGKWKFSESNKAVIKITVSDSYITMTDYANSKYRIVRRIVKDEQQILWTAIDETGETCKVQFMRFEETETSEASIMFSVYYNNDTFSIVYVIDLNL